MTAPVVDSHAHVFRQSLSFIKNRRYAPSYDASVQQYLALLDEQNIRFGVLVQPSFLGTDNSYLVESLRLSPERLRGIAVVNPSVTTDEMDALSRAGVVGIRLNLIGLPLPNLGGPEWSEALSWIAAQGWQVEIHRSAVDLPVLMEPLLERGIKVVLDHFGRPDPTLGAADSAFRNVLALAEPGGVWFKVSGVYRVIPPGMPWVAPTRALVDALLETVGASRLVWGSDWPHTQHEDTQSFAATRAVLPALNLSGDVEETILSSTPIHLFGFGQ
jgi:predicted TIM-barrel fold metal-dependent hydrolase